MDLYAWVLALHLVAAFTVAAVLVLFSAMVSSGRRTTTLEQTRTLFRIGPSSAVATPLGAVYVVTVWAMGGKPA